jgi:nifR3 family TIM-barrel protein
MAVKIHLAPMAGITDKAYRALCKRYGCALTVSEMISAKGVYYGDKKTVMLADSNECEAPYSLQIFGSEPEIMAIAAQKLLEINPQINVCDINMGCPMPKITNNGEGSALMKNPELAGKVVKAVVDATRVPVSVKMRIGWDKNSINATYFAQVVEANGASAICVHGRTREQLYAPPVDYKAIKSVKQAVKIPVVANGGVYSSEDAITLLNQTGCEAVAIGQGAMGNPFIFKECLAAFKNQPYVAPVSEEILKIAIEHVKLLCKDKGDYIGVREARKHLGWYIKGMPGATEARRKINASESMDELIYILSTLKNG